MGTNNLGKPSREQECPIWFVRIKSICGTYVEICGCTTGNDEVLCGLTKEEAEELKGHIVMAQLGLTTGKIIEVIKL